MINFKISQVSPSLTLVKLKGHLDESSRKYFFDCVRGAIFGRTKKNVVIDLSGVGAISTGGLEALLETEYQTRRKGGRIFLTDVNPKISDILLQTKLSSLSVIHPSTQGLVNKLTSEEIDLLQVA